MFQKNIKKKNYYLILIKNFTLILILFPPKYFILFKNLLKY